MFVIPAPGIQVRDPISRLHIPAAGKEVPESSYWIRRISAGDVVLSVPPVVVVDQIPDSYASPEDDQS